MNDPQGQWQILAADGYPLYAAETEGEAWLKLMYWDGKYVNGTMFLSAVRYLRRAGFRAVENRTDKEEYEPGCVS